MQATSTPTLAQPKSSAFAALGGAAVLAAAIGVGALIGANISTIAAPTAGNDGNVAAYALGVQRNGEIGALTPAQALGADFVLTIEGVRRWAAAPLAHSV